MFADRQTAIAKSGALQGSNVNATIEPDEPRHGGEKGGHSLWLSWTAPATGIVTFDTTGSDFHTLMSAYRLKPDAPNASAMSRLDEVERADDKQVVSLIQFGVTAGTTYEIGVDGLEGAVGAVRLNWNLLAADQPPPIFLQVPPDRSLRVGDSVTLTVLYQAGDNVKLAWQFNGDDDHPAVIGNETATLVIPNFQRENAGRYQLRITSDGVRFTSAPIEIQINSEGLTASLARDHLLDAAQSGVKADDLDDDGNRAAGSAPITRPRSRVRLAGLHAAPIGVARGYNGAQIFNTAFATSDPGEPQHCGFPTGGSYWFAYQAPVAGTLALDTAGSNFDTVLAVYTYDPPLAGFEGLRQVACDRGSGGAFMSRLRFAAEANRNYLAVVEGVNDTRGIAHLNYALAVTPTLPVPAPPTITRPPLDQLVVPGGTATFTVAATGTEPLAFQWFKNGTAIPGATTAALALAGVSVADAGNYAVSVINAAGSVTSLPVTLTINLPPTIVMPPLDQTVVLGSRVIFSVDAGGTPPFNFQWSKEGVAIEGANAATFLIERASESDAGRYTVSVANAAGTVTSPAVGLAIQSPPVIIAPPVNQISVIGGRITFSVAASGTPPLAFQWQKDGTDMVGATSTTVSLSNVAAADAAGYNVKITNPVGAVNSAVATLGVFGLPTAAMNQGDDSIRVSFVAAGVVPFVIESAPSLNASDWLEWAGPLSTNGSTISFTADPRASSAQFFRLRLR